MQLVTKYKKPVCVVRENSEGFLRGSARGVSHGPIPDLRQFFMDSGYFDYAFAKDPMVLYYYATNPKYAYACFLPPIVCKILFYIS